MNRKDRIAQKLHTLNPQLLEIIDTSDQHKNHIAVKNLTQEETHIKIVISSESLNQYTNLEKHRIINDLLKDEFKNGLHAAEIKII